MRLLGAGLHARARFYDALATAIDAGLPVDRALATLAGSGDAISAAVGAVVARGEMLSRGLAAQGRALSRFELAAVAAGERAGRLPQVLRRLARAFAVRGKARDRVAVGLLYPLLLLHAAVLLPPLYRLFRGGLWSYLGAVVPVLAVAYGAAALGFWLYRGTTASEAGKLRRDRLLLALPGISKAVRALALAEYAHAFAVLFASGLPLPETLATAAEATRNRVFRAAGKRVCATVRRGATVHEGLAAELDVFPRTFVQAVAIGEEAGQLEESLEKAEEAARREAERATIGLAVAVGVAAYALAALVIAWVVIRFWLGIARLPEGL